MEEGNSGIRFTVGLIVTLLCLTILLSLFTIFLTNSKEMQDREAEFRQLENDSISLIEFNNFNNYYNSYDSYGV